MTPWLLKKQRSQRPFLILTGRSLAIAVIELMSSFVGVANIKYKIPALQAVK